MHSKSLLFCNLCKTEGSVHTYRKKINEFRFEVVIETFLFRSTWISILAVGKLVLVNKLHVCQSFWL